MSDVCRSVMNGFLHQTIPNVFIAAEVPTMNILQKNVNQSDGYELATMMTKGTKVKRGKDWHYGNQDGNGEGTVTQPVDPLGIIHVKWDANENENNYKMGMDDKFELMLACDSTTGKEFGKL